MVWAARCRIAHPSPHDTVAGAVQDGSVIQKVSNNEWIACKMRWNGTAIYRNDQTMTNNLKTL